jgi:hypothetical protein
MRRKLAVDHQILSPRRNKTYDIYFTHIDSARFSVLCDNISNLSFLVIVNETMHVIAFS